MIIIANSDSLNPTDMLSILMLLTASAQLHVTVCNGGDAIDYDNQSGWGGYCNKKASEMQSPVDVIVPEESKVAKGKLLDLPGTSCTKTG
jgi:hypothetical protein